MRPKFFRFAVPILALLALASSASAQLVSQGNEQIITYSGSQAYILSNTPVNPNLLTATGTNTFIMNVNPPTNAVRVYVTNDTANACSNLTLSIASTGNASLNSFNGNVNAWQTVQVQSGSGAFANSLTITLPASGTVAVTSQPIIGSKIAVFLVLSSACATTNVDMQVVFGTFSAGNPFVQGVVAPGANASAVNPIIIGGPDASGNNHAVQVNTTVSTLGNTLLGLPVGGVDVTSGATWSTVRYPGGSQDGPLAIEIEASALSNCGSTAIGSCIGKTRPPAGNGGQNGNPGLAVADMGMTNSFSTTFSSTGQSVSAWQVPLNAGLAMQVIESCHFTLVVGTVSGTTPTLDVYVQDSPDNTNWDDRIHFTQITTTGTVLEAGIAGTSVNQTIHARSNRAIAAGTIVPGPLDSYGQIVAVVGGTTPSFPIGIYINCK